MEFSAAIRETKTNTDLFEFARDPQFSEEFIESIGELRLNSDLLRYSAKGVKPKIAGAEHEYRIFADSSARLNAMRPGPPPFPGLELNRALKAKGLVPVEIERKIKAKGPLGRAGEEQVRSVHSFNWAISDQDRQRIEEADRQLVNFKPCTFEQFFPSVAAASAAANNRAPQGANR